jgi:hypothetical protein
VLIRPALSAGLLKPPWFFRLWQQERKLLFRLILRLRRKIKRIETVFFLAAAVSKVHSAAGINIDCYNSY